MACPPKKVALAKEQAAKQQAQDQGGGGQRGGQIPIAADDYRVVNMSQFLRPNAHARWRLEGWAVIQAPTIDNRRLLRLISHAFLPNAG
jgi:hypothetical protein